MKRGRFYLLSFCYFMLGSALLAHSEKGQAQPAHDTSKVKNSGIVQRNPALKAVMGPTATLLSPQDGAQDVSALAPTIQLMFSEPVFYFTTGVVLHEGRPDGPRVALGSFTVGDKNLYSFRPVVPLKPTTTYYLALTQTIIGRQGEPIQPATFSFKTRAIDWYGVGHPFSEQGAAAPNLVFSPDGTPYVAFPYLGKAPFPFVSLSVNKWTGTEWQAVGRPIAPSSFATNPSLAFDSRGTPYIAFLEDGKTTVQKFNGMEWVTVGSGRFSGEGTGAPRLAFSRQNIPYVTYITSDFGRSAANKVVVAKFDAIKSNWVEAGSSPDSPISKFSAYPNIIFDKQGVPYIVYREEPLQGRLTVKRLGTSRWETVGAPGFSAGAANFPSLAFDAQGTLYVAYQDEAADNKTTVMKFDGSAWVQVGSHPFSAGRADQQQLVVDAKGTLYAAHRDTARDNRVTILLFNGKEWVVAIPSPFKEKVNSFQLALDPSGTPYVAYDKQDGGVSIVKLG